MSTPQYLMLKAGGVRARMSILGNAAALSNAPDRHNPPSLRHANWREARQKTFRTVEQPLSQGFDTKNYGTKYEKRTPIWSTFSGPQFRNETDAHEHLYVCMAHQGWYCDVDCSERCIAIVACLPHGRYMAGYRLTDSGERVYFAQVFGTPDEAANFADGIAKEYAETEYDYNRRWNEAQELNDEINSAIEEVSEKFALRNHPRFKLTMREKVRALVAAVRKMQTRMESEYSDVEI